METPLTNPMSIQRMPIVAETDIIPRSLLEKLGLPASSSQATVRKPSSPKRATKQPTLGRKPNPPEPIKRFVCKTCSRKFARLRALFEHQKSHVSCYVCQFCKIRFNQREEMKKHLNTHSAEFEFRRIPSKTYSGHRSFIKSRISVAPMPGENFLNKPPKKTNDDDFRTKLRSKYSDLTNSKNSICEDDFKDLYFEIEPRLVFNHVAHEYVNAKFQCSICSGVASKESSMRVHCSRHTRTKPKDPAAMVLFKCSDCPFLTLNEKELQVHQLSHAPDIRFQKIPYRTYSRNVANKAGSSSSVSTPSVSILPPKGNSSARAFVSSKTWRCSKLPVNEPNRSSSSSITTEMAERIQGSQSGIVTQIKSEIPEPEDVKPTAVALQALLKKKVVNVVPISKTVPTDRAVTILPDFPVVQIKQEPIDYLEQQSDEEILP